MRYPLDAMEETFEEVTVLDKPMLFTCARVDRSTVPKKRLLYGRNADKYEIYGIL